MNKGGSLPNHPKGDVESDNLRANLLWSDSEQVKPFLSNLDYLESVITQKELRMQRRKNIAGRDPQRLFMTPMEYRTSKLEL
jgi:hypothetical protein